MTGDTNQVRPYLFENQTPLGTPDKPGYHLSVDLADHAIQWLKNIEAIQPAKPWFLYFAPAATRAPHQAPKALIEEFAGKFDMGWDEYRKQTFERQKQLGVIPQGTILTPRAMQCW